MFFRSSRFSSLTLLSCASLLALACGESDGSGTGSVRVLLEPEDVIIQGLRAGDGKAQINDGWDVEFQRYIAVLGGIQLKLATDQEITAESTDAFAVDLKKLPQQGLELWHLEDLEAGRWEFNYFLTAGGHGAKRHETVSEADFQRLEDEHISYLIEGTISQTGGVSCPPSSLATPPEGAEPVSVEGVDGTCYANPTIHFELGVEAETSYGPCSIDGVSGVAVTDQGSESVSITLHGDHLFFNGFPEGSESGVFRFAQWLADSDLNLDGTVTKEELKQIKPAELASMQKIQLGGSPVQPIKNLWDYVRAQLKTQGHYQGEGECPVDGVEIDHSGHDH